MSAFSLLIFPAVVINRLLQNTERSATDPIGSRRFGKSLEPRYIFGAMKLDQ
jgi:hypothetical protein